MNKSINEIVYTHDDERNVKTVAISHLDEYVNGINGLATYALRFIVFGPLV